MGNKQSYSLDGSSSSGKKEKNQITHVHQKAVDTPDVIEPPTPTDEVFDDVAVDSPNGLSRAEFEDKVKAVAADRSVTCSELADILSECFCSGLFLNSLKFYVCR